MNKVIFPAIMIIFLASKVYGFVNIEKIIAIESSGNTLARSDKGAVGSMQITPIVLLEFNKFEQKSYTFKDLENHSKNVEIGDWYINARIPQLHKALKIPDTLDNRLISYNAGVAKTIGYIRHNRKLPPETKNYIKKYKGIER